VAANHLVPVLEGSDLKHLDSTLLDIERERMPEIKKIQRFQELPPRVGFSHSWWGEPLRLVVSQMARFAPVRLAAGGRLSIFPFGVTDVELRV